MLLKVLALILLLVAALSGQQLNLSVQDRGGSTLPGSCTETGSRFTLTTTAALYICNGSVYKLSGAVVSISGAGTPNAGGTNPTSCPDPAAGILTLYTDTSTSTKDIWRCVYGAANTWRLQIDSDGAGGTSIDFPEGACATGASGHDILCANSAMNGFSVNNNNGGQKRVPQVSGSWAANDCPKAADTLGNLISTGSPCVNSGTVDQNIPLLGTGAGQVTPNGVPAINFTAAASGVVRVGFIIPSLWTGTLADVTISAGGDGTDNTKTFKLNVAFDCGPISDSPSYNTAGAFTWNDSATQYRNILTTITSMNITGCVKGTAAVLQITDPNAGYTSAANHFLTALNIYWH